jgi:hypothetical protein
MKGSWEQNTEERGQTIHNDISGLFFSRTRHDRKLCTTPAANLQPYDSGSHTYPNSFRNAQFHVPTTSDHSFSKEVYVPSFITEGQVILYQRDTCVEMEC